jgi:hypothetical protein
LLSVVRVAAVEITSTPPMELLTASSTGSGASITYQWQRSTNSGTSFSDVSGGTNQTLALTGLTATENGYQYRVKVNNSIGGVEVISTAATLTTDSNA